MGPSVGWHHLNRASQVSAVLGGDGAKRMKKTAIILLYSATVLLPFSRAGGQGTNPDFQSLYESHGWFDLRDAVQQGNPPPFYSGVVACVFQEIDKAF